MYISEDELYTQWNSGSVLERFRLAYFRSGTIDGDPEMLDEALDPRNWTGDAPIQASLGALLGLFSQFLLAEYAGDAMPFYPILKFHSRNFELLEWLSKQRSQSALYQTVAGVHLTLAREVEDFLSVVERNAEQLNRSDVVHIAAEGPIDTGYFSRLLESLEFRGVSVESVRPRNSPVDLALYASDHPWLIALVALVLSTRTRFELKPIASSVRGHKSEHSASDAPANQIISVKTGFLQERPDAFAISVRTVMPRSLLLDLHLEISTKLFKHARETFLFFLSGTGAPAPPQPGQEVPPI